MSIPQTTSAVAAPMVDLAQWTIADAIQRIPLGAWWGLVGALAAVFAAGYALAHWIQSRKLENTESELAVERAQPRLSLVLGCADRDVGDVAHLLRFSFSKPDFIHPEIVEVMRTAGVSGPRMARAVEITLVTMGGWLDLRPALDCF